MKNKIFIVVSSLASAGMLAMIAALVVLLTGNVEAAGILTVIALIFMLISMGITKFSGMWGPK